MGSFWQSPAVMAATAAWMTLVSWRIRDQLVVVRTRIAMRCAAHPGYAGVGVPGELHQCRGRQRHWLQQERR
jgi:hypothetical protein